MKTIIAGSRSITNYPLIETGMNEVPWTITEVVSGTASGVDTLGERWGREHAIPIRQFPADWKTYGKRAGFLRNQQMAMYADALVAFHDGKSRGTANMIALAKTFGLKVHTVII